MPVARSACHQAGYNSRRSKTNKIHCKRMREPCSPRKNLMDDQSPKHIIAVSALVSNDAGKILMVCHPKRGWELPGGQVQLGESLSQALLREIREESGLTSCIGPLASLSSQLSAPHMLMFMFLGKCTSGEVVPGGEIKKAEWVNREEVLGRIDQPVTRDPIVDALEFQGRILYRIYSLHPYTIHEETFLNDFHARGWEQATQ